MGGGHLTTLLVDRILWPRSLCRFVHPGVHAVWRVANNMSRSMACAPSTGEGHFVHMTAVRNKERTTSDVQNMGKQKQTNPVQHIYIVLPSLYIHDIYFGYLSITGQSLSAR